MRGGEVEERDVGRVVARFTERVRRVDNHLALVKAAVWPQNLINIIANVARTVILALAVIYITSTAGFTADTHCCAPKLT